MRWFNAGIVSIALLLGFLVGASHTPVAGVAITATFGLLAAVFALHQKASVGKELAINQNLMEQLEQLKPTITDALDTLGRTLVVFALSFSIGLACGIYLRIGQPFGSTKAPATFPWVGLAEPVSSMSAIDWILVQEKLRMMGYDDAQIRSLYEKDAKFIKDKPPNVFGMGLLSPLFPEIERRDREKKDTVVGDHPIAQALPPSGWSDGRS